MTRRTAAIALGVMPLLLAPGLVAEAAPRHKDSGPVGADLPFTATATGYGGAVATVDPIASAVAIEVLKRGGTAADAAVAATATLNVVEPYATGMGGGGFFVYYDAKSKKVETIDGRETAPAAMTETAFLDEDGEPMEFWTAVNSGLSVGVPGTPATWQAALDRYGTFDLDAMLKPAQKIAERGFVVDEAFAEATQRNAERFAMFPDTAAIFLPGGEPVAAGDVIRQPDLAKTLKMMRTHGIEAFYDGPIAEAMVEVVNEPVTAEGVTVPRGSMTREDLRSYEVLHKDPIHSTYKGLDVYGMSTPSSGGVAIAQILGLLEAGEKKTGTPLAQTDDVQYLHRFAEASAAAFADRNRYVADVEGVPIEELLSSAYLADRVCGFSETTAAERPIAPGVLGADRRDCTTGPAGDARVNEGGSTTHLTVADKYGNVASYTSTIEQFGGSGITVPGYGFLLNNELTDFEFEAPTAGVPHPNLPAPGKRPRSSMAPTIVLENGRPVFAAGAAGGATIITTTAQILTGYFERDLTAVGAVNAPRLSSRNTAAGAESRIVDTATGAALRDMGHTMSTVEALGRATAIAMPAKGVFVPAAERTRGGGGSAMVVEPQGR
ncbi:MAG: gamma-glutamyltransferase [Mobilicoccus sp.]|nr:gamma-glutamyltransferase [Mobilicoccus sp.]